jgi:integrase
MKIVDPRWILADPRFGQQTHGFPREVTHEAGWASTRRPDRGAVMATLKLTERAIAALAPASRERVQEHYWDTDLKGFCLVVGARLKTFVVVASVRGKKRRVKIGVAGRPREDGQPWTLALARKRAHELLGEMAGGIDPNSELRTQRGGPTLRDGLELHLANMRKKNRSQRSIHTITTEVPRLLPDWIDLPMTEMRGADLVAVHDRLSGEGKTFLANRIVAHVSAIWNALDRVYELAGRNPARAVTRNRYDPKRERVNDEELPAWYERLQTLSPVRRDLQLFVLFTGMRSDATRRIRWADMDWKRGALRVPKPKGGESRAFDLPLSKTCLDVLKRRQKENAIEFDHFGGDAGWVFPSLSRSKPFRVQPIAETKERRVNESTGERESYMPGLHNLRRTFLSVAAEAGVSELDRHVLANHAFGRQSVNATYVAQAFAHLLECQSKIDAALWKRIRTKGGRRSATGSAPRSAKRGAVGLSSSPPGNGAS